MDKKKTVADEVIDGFTELADALEQGDALGLRFNCYQMRFDLKPQTYTPELVKSTRKLLGASQAVFARFLGMSPSAIRQWEQGHVVPKAVACRFMDEIRLNPDYYIKRLHESVVPKNGKKKKSV